MTIKEVQITSLPFFMRLARKEASIACDSNRMGIGAVVTRGRRYVSSGRNNMHKSHAGYLPYYQWPTIHAEFAACRKIHPKYLDGCEIWVYRKKRDGQNSSGLAKPCPACQEYLITVGIRKVYYSLEDNNSYRVLKLQ